MYLKPAHRSLRHRIIWSPGADLNCRPHPYQGCALPTELPGPEKKSGTRRQVPGTSQSKTPSTSTPGPSPSLLERVMGIEPTPSAWKAEVLPLNYTRSLPVLPTVPRLNLVEGGGFEPPKAEPADLQSDPFGHSGTPPRSPILCFSQYLVSTDFGYRYEVHAYRS